MFYFERTYKVLNMIGRLSEKVLYDSIKPFTEAPPAEKNMQATGKTKDLAADLFSLFTADIMKENIQFTR